MASDAASRKRRIAVGSQGLAMAAPKRIRFDDASKTAGKESWEERRPDEAMELTGESPNESMPLSPASSFRFTEPSIAETSMTSASTSKRPKKYLCDYPDCGKAFDRPVRLQMHTRSHTNERPYACEEAGCEKTFLRSEHLTRHMKDKHSEEKDYVCTYTTSNTNGADVLCDKSFTTATRLRRHLAAHEAKEETRCQEPGCGKMFRKQETLQRHIKQDHLHEKAYGCDHVDVDEEGQQVECNKSFSKPEQLKNHKAREHAENRYYCDICSPNHDHHTHMMEIDSLSVGAETEKITFPTYADLQHHMKIDHPPTCNECGKQCSTNRALKAHIDIDHTSLSERQQYHCTWPGCERSFTKTGNLKVHIRNVHTKARNFVCGTFDLARNVKVEGWDHKGCGSAFGTKANLEDHVQTQHLGYPSKIRPCRLKKIKAEEGSDSPSVMDVDEVGTPDNDLSLLTGFGFQDSRNIPCLVTACDVRFARDSNLAQHLELTHGWSTCDIDEALVERDALAGGKFWIGGEQSIDAEDSLRRQLTDALAPSQHDDHLKFSDYVPHNISGHIGVASLDERRTLSMRSGDGEEAIPVDPALMETTTGPY